LRARAEAGVRVASFGSALGLTPAESMPCPAV
jgi:hypothetical protein